jgi:hypothetical protein
MNRLSRISAVALLVAFVAAFGTANAQDKTPEKPMQMPPGMTPEIMKMMEKPGPPHPPGLPKEVGPVSGCIPAMGFHYVSKANWPEGPIYGYYNGKPVFTEIMPTKEKFENGFDINNALRPLPGYKIDHVDIWYEPNGHPGMTVPHYDIHAYYVSHAEHMKYCNNKSGKRPAFV